MLVDVQVSVAADADVPSFGVARIAKDRAVLLIKALGALVHLDVGPLVLKTGGDDDGARQKPLDGERFSSLSFSTEVTSSKSLSRRTSSSTIPPRYSIPVSRRSPAMVISLTGWAFSHARSALISCGPVMPVKTGASSISTDFDQ